MEVMDSGVRRISGVLSLLCRPCSFPYQVVTSTNSKKLPRRGKYHCMFLIKPPREVAVCSLLVRILANLIDIFLKSTNQFRILYIKWIRVVFIMKEIIH
jgi:hypothetical protein